MELVGLPSSGGPFTPRRLVWWIIGVGTALRFGLAAALGLGVDESYMVATARQLHLSYFDHPPMAWWLTHASIALFGSESHLAARLPFVALFALTSWLIYRITARAFGEAEGLVAAGFLNLSPVFSLSGGSWVLPDGPLLCALAAAAYCLVRVLLEPVGGRDAWRWWLGAGATTGIGLLSKYQAILFFAGAFLFLLARPGQRGWLRRVEPYAAAVLATALFAPVVVWNARHGWASFAFQLGRAGSSHPVGVWHRLGALATNVAGQAAWIFPWIWVPLVWALVSAFRRRPAEDRYWLFACLAVVPVALFTGVSLGGQPGLPHWPASGYLFCFPLLGAIVMQYFRRQVVHVRLAGPSEGAITRGTAASTFGHALRSSENWRALRPLGWWIGSSIVAFIVLTGAAASIALTGWPELVFPSWPANRDPTVEALDWRELPHGLDSLGVLARPNTFIAGTSWVQTGKASYALGPKTPVLCLCADPREFGFEYDQRDFLGQDAVIVDRLPARHDLIARFAPYFERVTWLGNITIRRFGVPVFEVGVYVGHKFVRPVPATSLPPGAFAAVPWGAGVDYLPPVPVES